MAWPAWWCSNDMISCSTFFGGSKIKLGAVMWGSSFISLAVFLGLLRAAEAMGRYFLGPSYRRRLPRSLLHHELLRTAKHLKEAFQGILFWMLAVPRLLRWGIKTMMKRWKRKDVCGVCAGLGLSERELRLGDLSYGRAAQCEICTVLDIAVPWFLRQVSRTTDRWGQALPSTDDIILQ